MDSIDATEGTFCEVVERALGIKLWRALKKNYKMDSHSAFIIQKVLMLYIRDGVKLSTQKAASQRKNCVDEQFFFDIEPALKMEYE